jgi:hypothetical protein
MIQTLPLAWGKRVDQPFRDRVYRLCAELSWTEEHASWAMACMALETGRTFSPSIKSPVSSATGLIQFMRKTAAYLGTSTVALAKMSAVQQLDYVQRYFAPHAPRIRSLEDMYMAIIWPAAIGKPIDQVLWPRGTAQYKANKGLDRNGNGYVTKREAAQVVRDHLAEGMRPGNVLLPGGYV